MQTTPRGARGGSAVHHGDEQREPTRNHPEAQPVAPTHSWLRYPSATAHTYGALHCRMRRLVLAEEPNCRSCGAPSQELDHIRPISSGGETERDNLQALCRPCHLSKSGREANFRRWHILRIPKRKGVGRG